MTTTDGRQGRANQGDDSDTDRYPPRGTFVFTLVGRATRAVLTSPHWGGG